MNCQDESFYRKDPGARPAGKLGSIIPGCQADCVGERNAHETHFPVEATRYHPMNCGSRSRSHTGSVGSTLATWTRPRQ